MRYPLPYQPACPVCGDPAVNPQTLGLRFALELPSGVVSCPVRWESRHLGFVGRVHGGLVALVLDEAMAWAAAAAVGSFCTTGELRLKLLQAVPPETELAVRAWSERTWGRYVRTASQLVDAAGKVLVEASASFAAMPREESHALKRFLVFRPGDYDVLHPLPPAPR
jgi:acyl-coenzyme A thioesterase PaaI-like protein